MSDIWPDLRLNLFSELIGILITTFLVNQIVQRQQDKKMQPAKNILYAKLIWQLHIFLKAVAPMTIRKDLGTENSPTIPLHFGSVLCPISARFHAADYAFLKDIYQKSEVPYLMRLYPHADQLRADLDRMIDTLAFLMDPVLLKDSFELLENLKKITRPETGPNEMLMEKLVYSINLAKSVEKAIHLMNSLLDKTVEKPH